MNNEKLLPLIYDWDPSEVYGNLSIGCLLWDTVSPIHVIHQSVVVVNVISINYNNK